MHMTSKMKTIVRFYTGQAFQDLLESLVEEYKILKTEHPRAFVNISISVKRIVAAALIASHDAPTNELCWLMDEALIPDRSHEDKAPADKPFQSTLGASMRIIDYAKFGSTRLNIDVFGPIEDHRQDLNPAAAERYRLTYRQYIHISLIYLSQLSAQNKIVSILASEEIDPFNRKGPGERVKSEAIERVDKKLVRRILRSRE